jgi:hypothetical protein
MKKFGIVVSLALVTMLLAGSALAQNVGDKSVYFTTFYANANIAGAPDSTLRIVNDGSASTAEVEGQPNGNLWASIYVFDDSQEMQECCSCFISADGLLSESVNNELLANPLTGKVNHVGVIKVIGNKGSDPTSNTPAPGLKGNFSYDIAANTQTADTKNVVSKAVNAYLMLEHPLADSNLVSAEQTALQDSCSFTMTLGSGAGVCTCTPEDNDF